MQYLMYDGRITGIEDASLNHLIINNFNFIEAQIWHGYGGIPLLKENVELLKEQAGALRLPFPALLLDPGNLFRLTKRLLNKNRYYRSGYLNLRLIGNQAETHTLITCNHIPESEFPYATRGELAHISSIKKGTPHRWSHLTCFNGNIWQTGLAELAETPCRQVIFENDNGQLCDAAYANLFAVKGNQLLTPHPSTGCFIDSLRPVILDLAKEEGLQTAELHDMNKNCFDQVDEVFIASERLGIQWIIGVGNIRYFNTISKQLHDRLTIYLKNRAVKQ